MEFAHKVGGLESPTQHRTVVAAAEGAKKKLPMPVQPKTAFDAGDCRKDRSFL